MEDVEGEVRTDELDAEHEARRQLALAQIRQYPDPVLRMEARPAEAVDDDLERPVSLRIDGRDERGDALSHDLEGMAARIAQHEFDHLDGKLILDRTTPEARREAMAALRPRLVIR